MQAVAHIFLGLKGVGKPCLLYEEKVWSGDALLKECSARAHYILVNKPRGEFHVGLLLDNIPDYIFWIGACALAGAKYVALNCTRTGADLGRDVAHTECCFLITEAAHFSSLSDATKEALGSGLINVDAPGYREKFIRYFDDPAPRLDISGREICGLMFTSGTSAAPKAVIYSNARLMNGCAMLQRGQNLTTEDTSYVAMPLFHPTGLLMGALSILYAGGALALRRKFSASGFMPDVRKFAATYACYVGKPLAYILATPTQPDDAQNPLRLLMGSEASDVDIETFSKRFSCTVVDNFGSSEGCINIMRTPDTPRGSIGRAFTDEIRVMNTKTGTECARALFDERGLIVNGNDAIGELININGGKLFEGYWRNPLADEQKIVDGVYWSGDLAYQDGNGFFYFSGRNNDWLRVDGENISAVQIEQVLARHPNILIAVAYGVPDAVVGDKVMVAIELASSEKLAMDEFEAFLMAQDDFSRKWIPNFVRICSSFPVTGSGKIQKNTLKAQAWLCSDEVWWRPGRESVYELMTEHHRAQLQALFKARQREAFYPGAVVK